MITSVALNDLFVKRNRFKHFTAFNIIVTTFFTIFFDIVLSVIDSLSNINVRIPEFIQTGDSADLTCSFNLGGDDLYSVKWYKGRHEFYRFMPNEKPKIKIFPVKGMKINVSIIRIYIFVYVCIPRQWYVLLYRNECHLKCTSIVDI